ncbi:DUF1002 domain-containing protein [Porcincola intestinalis]|uniref:DUF1002 domain-containing protein n=1 Tax=Porcincola intestinalis TaxID=2606632 RepID=UPI0023EFFD63|nr:DUF1002 domain-containing protein [Porcincola intestinalis]MDD7059309.1 DUF1002 domain-containing protein [Porcincola intestinalis]MDY5282578.1 DUF1002 domain-containing protein [Porcincola intestinalis]MDY5578809.1 DUF1002 domain-containing protein [Porcincola intestinalis]
MKKKVVSILAAAAVAASLLGGAAPLTVLADGTMVVSIGADLTEDQKSAILRYFGIYGNNSVQTITVTNQDERSHLASYIPIEQIGTRTISCALVKPTTTGGVQVKTANLNYITSNMIASNLITCGVTNCQAIAAAPFEVSGTGALTGILMAYENATGSQISQQAKDLSAQEIQITENLSNSAENQQVAQQIVNDVKLQVINGTVDESQNTDNSVITNNTVNDQSVTNIVNNVVNQYTTNNNDITLSQEDVQQLTDYAKKLAEQAYQQGAAEAKAQLEAQSQVQKDLSQTTGVANTDNTQKIVDDTAKNQSSTEKTTEAGSSSAGETETASSESEASIFSDTDLSALNNGDTGSTLVTGTDSAVIQNDIQNGASDNDKLIAGEQETQAQSETSSQADASGLVITTQDSNTEQTTQSDAAQTPETQASDAQASDQPQTAVTEPAAGAAAPITTDQTSSYSTTYLSKAGEAFVPSFAVALKSDSLIPVSGTFTVADASGNVLGSADLADKSQVTAVSRGTANDEFKSENNWDQLTGLFFLPKDTNGNPVVPAAGTTYQLTLSGTFAQTTDASAVSSAPQVSVDLQNVTYSASAQAASGLNLGNVSLSDLKAGAMLSAAVADDGSFAAATLSSPDGTAAVNTADGSSSVTAGGDLSVTVTLQNAPGLAEVDLQYSAAGAGETESADASAQGSTLRYFIPVQAQ